MSRRCNCDCAERLAQLEREVASLRVHGVRYGPPQLTPAEQAARDRAAVDSLRERIQRAGRAGTLRVTIR